MKQKDYMKKLLKQIVDEGQILCDDCGQIDKIGHAIINHQDNSLKVVCNKCFKNKYLDGLYERN